MSQPTRRHVLLGAAGLSAGLVGAPHVARAAWPDRPVKLVVPFAPGGSYDTTGRLIAEGISPLIGQNVVVENRPGAGGIVGSAAVARAPGDGYTLVLGGLTAQILVQGVNADLPFRPMEDFVPVALVAKVPLVLVAARQLNVRTAQDLASLVRAAPGQYNFSSAGNGTSGHIAAQHFSNVAGLQATHVPYRGSAAGLADLLAGRIAYLVDTPSVVAEHVRTSFITGLAVLSDARTPTLPNVPTMKEAGFPQVNSLEPWQAVLAPKGTPPEITTKLNQAINAVIARPEVRARFAAIDLTPMSGSQQEAARFFREENDRWVPLVREMNITA
ncbi:Bug family tripartite tricarboxylate transporter substrate binding protein [Roseomonas xinghualingensis]|uniref:Bug family tripartite tricarboxylate transporter substrate binding protein n=1 Tax=Roseomonas xinghualingensis TaxID=2986475 RepID=UPI0021F11F45|nr:tripartite tricarboxylate transporter substrate binding protein [Roseomonas sp. SXEYE001]MCV4206610.1 tripartite tricarboxylate transporter substrate binding protein [Roseomonas sp. SXEYE001]